MTKFEKCHLDEQPVHCIRNCTHDKCSLHVSDVAPYACGYATFGLNKGSRIDLLGLSAAVPAPSHKGNVPSHCISISEISCLTAQIHCLQGRIFVSFDRLVWQAGCRQGNMSTSVQEWRYVIYLSKMTYHWVPLAPEWPFVSEIIFVFFAAPNVLQNPKNGGTDVWFLLQIQRWGTVWSM